MNQATYYTSLSKTDIFLNPGHYAWNCLLYYVQFSQDELLAAKEWIDIIPMVKYQRCLTRSFIRQHFADEVDMSDLLTWEHVEKYVPNE
jgi:hypothetical protein